MNKDDVKAIFLIFFMLLLISAIVLIGINMYINIMQQEKSEQEVLYQGNTTIAPNEENSNNISKVEQQGEALNKIESASKSDGEQDSQANTPIKKEQYYYKQLNLYAKLIYDKLTENKENLKSGTYKIDFGEEFNELLEQENGTELLQDYYQSGMETYLYDNPDVFYLDPTKMYINIQTTRKVFTTTFEVYIDSGENPNYFAESYSSQQQIIEYENKINQEVLKILSKTDGKNEYQKILTVHDYLVDNLSYEETISKDNIYNIYGALVNKEAVCEGYAKAFKYLMDQIGVESIVVIGTAIDSEEKTQNHAWNYVNLNNTWYAVDTTWDDPVIIGGKTLGKKHKYKYFLKGSNTMSKDHTEAYTFVDNGKVYTHPILSIADYE